MPFLTGIRAAGAGRVLAPERGLSDMLRPLYTRGRRPMSDSGQRESRARGDTGRTPMSTSGLMGAIGAAALDRLDLRGSGREPEVRCAKCNLRETCLSGGVPAEDLKRVENIVFARRRIGRGERLFGAGDVFRCIFAIRAGSFKTSFVDGAGREQVTGFFMGGELLGLGGLGSGRHADSAIAIEDSDVCVMPYSLIEEVGREVPLLQRRLHSVLAREIVRDHGIMLLLGSMSAEQRLAAFLLNLSRRLQARQSWRTERRSPIPDHSPGANRGQP